MRPIEPTLALRWWLFGGLCGLFCPDEVGDEPDGESSSQGGVAAPEDELREVEGASSAVRGIRGLSCCCCCRDGAISALAEVAKTDLDGGVSAEASYFCTLLPLLLRLLLSLALALALPFSVPLVVTASWIAGAPV